MHIVRDDDRGLVGTERDSLGENFGEVGVARASARPKAGGIVIGAAGQKVTKRVPRQTPDRALVRTDDTLDGRGGAEGVPKVEVRIVAARCEDRLLLRVPTNCSDLFLVASEHLPHAHGPDVHQHDELVARSACQKLPMRAPLHPGDRIVVAIDRGDSLACSWIPQLYLRILRASSDEALRRVPIATLDVPPVACEGPLLIASAEIPHLGMRIFRT
mmetsp:Transcript_114947/g.330102  ORF Transcript_114947/g.330102 Transcript_114947/m.330102 type:complete len:216 (-) Transcript_114947:626-1273(-)